MKIAISVVILAFLFLVVIESIYSWRKNKALFRLNDTLSNLGIGVGSRIFGLFSKIFLLLVYVWMYENVSLFNIPFTWWSVVLCLILFDFLFYWAHRWGHEVNFFWGAHSVHHQSEEYNLSVALRQSWIHDTLAFVIFLPIPLLGFDVVTFAIASSVDSFYQFWIHTRVIKKMPNWFEFVFNTPSHHRVHHGINPKYIDKNHAGVFIIWDRMFGTFQKEEEEPVYGITKQLKSWNPFWANVHYYIELIEISKGFNSVKDKIRLIFSKPGWMPENLGGYKPVESIHDNPKYDVTTNKLMMRYVFVQFVLILVGTIALLYHFENLTLGYQLLSSFVILLSVGICGAILENKTWIRIAEHVRLIVILLGLNTLYFSWYPDWSTVVLVLSAIGFVYFNIWFFLRSGEATKSVA